MGPNGPAEEVVFVPVHAYDPVEPAATAAAAVRAAEERKKVKSAVQLEQERLERVMDRRKRVHPQLLDPVDIIHQTSPKEEADLAAPAPPEAQTVTPPHPPPSPADERAPTEKPRQKRSTHIKGRRVSLSEIPEEEGPRGTAQQVHHSSGASQDTRATTGSHNTQSHWKQAVEKADDPEVEDLVNMLLGHTTKALPDGPSGGSGNTNMSREADLMPGRSQVSFATSGGQGADRHSQQQSSLSSLDKPPPPLTGKRAG